MNRWATCVPLQLGVLISTPFVTSRSASAGDVLWITNPYLPTIIATDYVIGPSAVSSQYDGEAADDFNVIGQVERVLADGFDCFGCGAGQPVTGAWVRFYAWTPAGPGDLQFEHYFASNDPAFVWSPGSGPGFLQFALPQPFQATGWHFVSVQVTFAGPGEWNFHRTNVGSPMGGPAVYRDGAGQWQPFHPLVGWPPVDCSFALEGTPTGTPPPQILDVVGNPANPSGRLRIVGDNFGDAQGDGQILVAGVAAFVTQWTDQAIVAYVPEQTTPGSRTLELVIGGQAVSTYDLTIQPRQPDGRVRWRFAIDADYTLHRPGIAPDGSLYVNDVRGRLYKLAPDGGLVWIVDALRGQTGLGSAGPVVVGADGTVYVAVDPLGPSSDLLAYNPDGSLKWAFTEPHSWGPMAGPNIGPDGHVYIVFHDPDGETYGACSFTSAGELRWSTNGVPYLYEHAALGCEIAFSASKGEGPPDQIVITADRDNDRWVYAFNMVSGAQNWAVPATVVEPVFLQDQMHTVGGAPGGSVYMTEFIGTGGLGWGLQEFLPNGQRGWRFDPGINADVSAADVAADGTIYISWDISRVGAVSPQGSELWRHVDFDGIRSGPIVSPDESVVLVAGGNFGVPGRFKALEAATGTELWRVELPQENLGQVVPNVRALFTPDGTAAYFPASILGDPEEFAYSYLYALNVGAPAIPGDLDGDGDVDQADLGRLLAAFGSCAGDPAFDPMADINQDGCVDQADLGALLSNFGA